VTAIVYSYKFISLVLSEYSIFNLYGLVSGVTVKEVVIDYVVANAVPTVT
jgi:hypothetical protein